MWATFVVVSSNAFGYAVGLAAAVALLGCTVDLPAPGSLGPAHALVGHWPFDETDGAVAADGTAGGHDGTLHGGASWGTGHAGGALVLDGVDGYVEIPHAQALNPASRMTIAAWVQSMSATFVERIIVAKVFSATDHIMPFYSYSLHVLSSDELRFYVTLDDVIHTVVAVDTTNDGNWHHVAGVYDGEAIVLYVDGTAVGTAAASGRLAAYATPLRVGVNGELGEPWIGAIDDLRVYEVALSSADIAALADPAP